MQIQICFYSSLNEDINQYTMDSFNKSKASNVFRFMIPVDGLHFHVTVGVHLSVHALFVSAFVYALACVNVQLLVRVLICVSFNACLYVYNCLRACVYVLVSACMR